MALSNTIYKQRTEDELVDALQRLLDGLWGRKHQSHTLTIPVDELRDADCILMDGINELAKLRKEVATLRAMLPQDASPNANKASDPPRTLPRPSELDDQVLGG